MSLKIKNLCALCALLAFAGCAGRSVIPMADLTDPPESESYFVTTQQGEELEFVTFRATADSLQGTVRTVKQRVVGHGDDERVEARNQYREMALPLSAVQRVEVARNGPPSLVLAAASAVAVGGVYLLLNKSDEEPPIDDGGGGRPPPDIGGSTPKFR
jgi:hypothetical protein